MVATAATACLMTELPGTGRLDQHSSDELQGDGPPVDHEMVVLTANIDFLDVDATAAGARAAGGDP